MEDTELCIHDEAEYSEAVNRLDSLFDQLYGSKKKFNDPAYNSSVHSSTGIDPDEETFYISCLMSKIEKLQDAITDYEVALMQVKDNEL